MTSSLQLVFFPTQIHICAQNKNVTLVLVLLVNVGLKPVAEAGQIGDRSEPLLFHILQWAGGRLGSTKQHERAAQSCGQAPQRGPCELRTWGELGSHPPSSQALWGFSKGWTGQLRALQITEQLWELWRFTSSNLLLIPKPTSKVNSFD